MINPEPDTLAEYGELLHLVGKLLFPDRWSWGGIDDLCSEYDALRRGDIDQANRIAHTEQMLRGLLYRDTVKTVLIRTDGRRVIFENHRWGSRDIDVDVCQSVLHERDPARRETHEAKMLIDRASFTEVVTPPVISGHRQPEQELRKWFESKLKYKDWRINKQEFLTVAKVYFEASSAAGHRIWARFAPSEWHKAGRPKSNDGGSLNLEENPPENV